MARNRLSAALFLAWLIDLATSKLIDCRKGAMARQAKRSPVRSSAHAVEVNETFMSTTARRAESGLRPDAASVVSMTAFAREPAGARKDDCAEREPVGR
jgi:hypothetical protein